MDIGLGKRPSQPTHPHIIMPWDKCHGGPARLSATTAARVGMTVCQYPYRYTFAIALVCRALFHIFHIPYTPGPFSMGRPRLMFGCASAPTLHASGRVPAISATWYGSSGLQDAQLRRMHRSSPRPSTALHTFSPCPCPAFLSSSFHHEVQ